MKVLELFSGTSSFGNVAKENGHQVFTLDFDPKFKPDLCIDILNFYISMLPEEFKHPDIIWASPPCQTFSVASIYRYWDNGKPKNDKCLHGIAIAKKTIEVIKQLNPKFFIIENPRGMMRKQDFVQEFKRNTVTYCQYGAKTQKPTDLWNNLTKWNPKPMCKPGSPCHEAASRSSKKGIHGINNSFSNLGMRGAAQRAVIPKELCLEILRSCEDEAP